MTNSYLIYLNWPERCFCATMADVRYLKGLLPPKARVRVVRSEKAFLRALSLATHVFTWHFREEWYVRAPHLKVVATPAAGRELVSEKAPKGVRVHFGRFQGAFMAETVAAFILAWARGFFRPERTAFKWPRTALSDKVYEVAGTQAVIVGYGNVGRAIGAKLAALGVTVRGFRRRNLADLPKALPTADWFVMALPSTTGTDNFLNAALIRKLPRRCVVVNVGRGNAIDERSLVTALRTHRLAGAYLDVRKNEPSGTVPFFGTNAGELEMLPNCIRTPHSSAFSPKYMTAFFKELKDDGII